MMNQEELYLFMFSEFQYKNPSTDEKFYINYRITILEDVLKDCYKTADFDKGEYLDGQESIDGVWTTKATGTASDYIYLYDELEFYKSKLIQINEPKQLETVLPANLHNDIFKDNAFLVFERYHSTKELAGNCKTDLNLLFQLFKNDNLFVGTIELKHYINWLNKNYEYSLTELKKVNINSGPNINRANDYKLYKELTLK